MNIEIFGESERVREAARILSDEECKFDSIKLLPVPSSRDKIHITGTEIQLNEFQKGLCQDDFVVGYALPYEFRECLDLAGIKYYDASLDEDFLLENAYVTAIGTLAYILGKDNRIPRDMKFGVIGYGRIGRALSEILLFLGARLKIFSSKKLTRIELGFFGIESNEIELSDFEEPKLQGLDFVLNTAPTNLSYLFPEKCVPDGMRVIDLASGDSFPGVFGIEYLPSLPDRMFPKSAGKIYARRALSQIRKGK